MSIVEVFAPGSKCLPGDCVVELQGEVTVIGGRGLRWMQSNTQTSKLDGDSTAAASAVVMRLIATLSGVLRKSITCVPIMDASSSAEHSSSSDRQRQHEIVQYEITSPSARKYFPEVGDFVVGTIVKLVGGSGYQVHIGSSHFASLDASAFDGASKHSRPRLIPGDMVYAHVVRADPDLDTVLSCCSLADAGRKDWVTGEGVFGPLPGDGTGAVVRVALQFAREMIANECPVLSMLGRRVSFEVAVGVNGVVWLSTATSRKPGARATVSAAAAAVGGGSSVILAAAPSSKDERRSVLALVALCQCIAGAETDASPEQVQARIDVHFPVA